MNGPLVSFNAHQNSHEYQNGGALYREYEVATVRSLGMCQGLLLSVVSVGPPPHVKNVRGGSRKMNRKGGGGGVAQRVSGSCSCTLSLCMQFLRIQTNMSQPCIIMASHSWRPLLHEDLQCAFYRSTIMLTAIFK